jgi:hypothetical protein
MCPLRELTLGLVLGSNRALLLSEHSCSSLLEPSDIHVASSCSNQGAVDGFVDTLRHCATNIHTRIIILQEAILSQSDEDDAIEVLFHSHILGFELDLLPACVTRLSPTSMRKFQNVSSYMSRYQHTSLMDASANFGMSSGQSGNVAMYLGRRSFGDGTPYTGECM